MKKNVLLSFVLFLTLLCFGQQNVDNRVKELFNTQLKKESVKNAFLHVYSKSKDMNIQLAEGEFKTGMTVGVKNPFYVASIGKTFTATAIGILKDNKQLAFNDMISDHLPEDILNELHVLDGIDYSNKITIAHLLQHTSGLSDYFEDKSVDGTPNMMEQLFMKPTQNWTPSELIQFYKKHMKALFTPGTGYHYTDTEYVLLGLIIEQVSGLELHEFFKQHILKPLGMNNTYMNLRSEPIQYTSEMAEMYASNFEISSFKSLSADWAGGGIVSTTQDLITFQEALFNGALLKTETFASMQQWIPETQGMYYGFGLRKIVFNELHPSLPEIEVIGHSGSTGSFLYYCRKKDIYVSGTLNQTDEINSSMVLIASVLDIFNTMNQK